MVVHPAIATAIKRLNPSKLVFTYQGDGDLAAIGTAETIHACNRGENIAIIFINNGIYGMTGGQMAPTTLEGMVTSTCPYGRNVDLYGYPLKISDLVAKLDGSCYVTRQSVHNGCRCKKSQESHSSGIRELNGQERCLARRNRIDLRIGLENVA